MNGRSASSAAAGAIDRAPRRSIPRTRGQRLRDARDVLAQRALPPGRDGWPHAPAVVPARLEVDGDGEDHRAGPQSQRRRAGRECGALAEELDVDAVAGQVAVAQEADDA